MANQWIDVGDITPRIGYTATASQTAFAVPFVFFDRSSLHVYQNEVLLTLDVDYGVTGPADFPTGTVTLLTGATVGDAILISRHVPIEQTTHIPPSGPLDIPAVNFQISKLIAISQQLNDSFERSLRQPDSEDLLDMELPAARENKILGFDSNGAPIAVLGPSSVSADFVGATVVESKAVAQVTTFDVTTDFIITGGGTTAGDGLDGYYIRGTGTGSFTDGGGVSWKPFDKIADGAVTLPKIVAPSAVSRLLGSNANAALTITGAANNGSGLIRLTVASTTTFATGQKKIVAGVVGTTEANRRWTITVVDGTHIDLQSSTFTNAWVSGGTIGGGVDEIQVGSGLTLTGDTLTAEVPLSSVFGYLSGLELSTAGSSATFGIAAGAANAVAAGGMMVLASAYTKTTSAWAVGSGNGALDTGSIATSTWYTAFLIKRLDTGVVDVLISASASAPTMPANYTIRRRIGSMRTTSGSAQWVKFFQDGDEFLWDAQFTDHVAVSLGATALYTLTVPTGPSVLANFISYYNSTATNSYILITSPNIAAQTPNTPTANREQQVTVASGPSIARRSVMTNGNAQIRAAGNGVGTTEWYVNTTGWTDRRGK